MTNPSSGVNEVGAVNRRYHFLDASRAIMLLLGIPMHVGEAYRMSGGWMIASDNSSFAATFVTMIIHSFRMPAFFFLSGFFALMVSERIGGGPWLKGRFVKLGVPLVLTTLLIGPIEQTIVNVFSGHMLLSDAFVSALHAPLMNWLSHRWFLLILMLFCLTLWAALSIKIQFSELSNVLSQWGKRLGGFRHVAIVLLLVVISYGAIVVGKLIGDFLIPSPDLKQIFIYYVKYVAFFFLGCLVFASKDGLQSFITLSTGTVSCALLSLSIYGATYFGFFPESILNRHPIMQEIRGHVATAVELVAGFYVARLFFAITQRLLNKDNIVITYLVEASYSVYLIHLSVVLLICGLFLKVPGSASLEFFMISCLAIIIPVASFEIVRRSKILSWIFNGGPVNAKKLKTKTI